MWLWIISMFGPLAAKVLPRLAGLKTRAEGLMPSGNGLLAVSLAALVGIGVYWLMSSQPNPLAECEAAVQAANVEVLKSQRAADAAAQAAADRVRAATQDDLDAAMTQIADMERELEKLRAGGDNPVVYPEALAKELRR